MSVSSTNHDNHFDDAVSKFLYGDVMGMQRQKERDKRSLAMKDVWLWQTQSLNVISSSSTVLFYIFTVQIQLFLQA